MGREGLTYKSREVKGGRGGEEMEGREGRGWKRRGREMEGLLIRGGRRREGREGKGRMRVPPVIAFSPGVLE